MNVCILDHHIFIWIFRGGRRLKQPGFFSIFKLIPLKLGNAHLRSFMLLDRLSECQ